MSKYLINSVHKGMLEYLKDVKSCTYKELYENVSGTCPTYTTDLVNGGYIDRSYTDNGRRMYKITPKGFSIETHGDLRTAVNDLNTFTTLTFAVMDVFHKTDKDRLTKKEISDNVYLTKQQVYHAVYRLCNALGYMDRMIQPSGDEYYMLTSAGLYNYNKSLKNLRNDECRRAVICIVSRTENITFNQILNEYMEMYGIYSIKSAKHDVRMILKHLIATKIVDVNTHPSHVRYVVDKGSDQHKFKMFSSSNATCGNTNETVENTADDISQSVEYSVKIKHLVCNMKKNGYTLENIQMIAYNALKADYAKKIDTEIHKRECEIAAIKLEIEKLKEV